MSLELANQLAEEGDLENALRVVLPLIDEDFNDSQALFIAGYVFIKSEKVGLAYQLFKNAAALKPNVGGIWLNMGKCFHERQKLDEAERCFKEALRIKQDYPAALVNLGLINLNKAEYGKAIEYCNRALKSADDVENIENAKINRAISNLALGKWDWENYNLNIGKIKDRKEIVYKGEPRWNGEKGKRVVVFGEQGIGDEINFASCIPDLQKDCDVVIDCDKRLEGLFRRSFNCPTYGTRYKNEHAWAEKEEIDAHISIGALPQYYRQKDEDFPGTPFLKADPLMRAQWRALFDKLSPRMKVGIAWTAGRPHTFGERRSIPLETLAPLFELDADFISLEYKTPEGHEKYGIHHFPWGVECHDYDQTAALVAELDLVISVTTTVHHLAGALGKECWCLVPERSMWQQNTPKFLWANSVQLFRQKGSWPIQTLVAKLSSRLSTNKVSSATEGGLLKAS